MVAFGDTRQWREFLPESYDWLRKLPLNKASGWVEGAQHLVLVNLDKQKPGVWSYESEGISEAQASQITKEAQSFGWQGKASPFTVKVGSSFATLVVVNGLDVTPVQKARQAGMDLVGALKDRKPEHLVLLGSAKIPSLDMFEGLATGLYSCNKFKGSWKKGDDSFPGSVSLAGGVIPSQEALDARKIFLRASILTRMLQDSPPNWLNSERFAEIAQDVSQDLGLKCTVRGREEMKALGMGSFLSVAGGSTVDPKFILIEVVGKNPSKTVALVGKGLTFDSGGISLKPGQGMHEMKYDMSGGAAVLGAAYYLGQVMPPVNVVCLIGAVENMPGHDATRPGDIVKSMSGKTIEIQNTDAEGRLVLCDLLHYAVEHHKPEFVVDIATLTGAVVVALGGAGAAVISNDQSFAEYLRAQSTKVGEPLWQLPLWPEFAKEVKGDYSDLKNITSASVKAGTITAGCFLREFVGSARWGHLDIAGTGWDCKATGYPTSGSSSFGLRSLVAACMNWVENS